MKYRLRRILGGSDPKCYRVETEELLTQKEALQLMRDLGSPYNGQVYDNNPTPRPADAS